MSGPDERDLERFTAAQAAVWPVPLDELTAGRKLTHWMWFVLPQLRALGRSPRAVFYGLADLDEARRYAAHPVLGPRLETAAGAVLAHPDRTALAILGSPDDLKFRSCCTLFEVAVPGAAVFAAALDTFYAGGRCEPTLALIGR
ncbi:MAG: DUF1810 domain-containing protein [Pseudomonadota bacterium]